MRINEVAHTLSLQEYDGNRGLRDEQEGHSQLYEVAHAQSLQHVFCGLTKTHNALSSHTCICVCDAVIQCNMKYLRMQRGSQHMRVSVRSQSLEHEED